MSVHAHRTHLASDPGDGGPRRSLILAGGGMRVAYQAGVLVALDEAGLRFTHADGTSGGILNLAMLLSGLSPVEMCERWRSLNVRDFGSLLPIERYLRACDLLSLGDASGMVDKVFPHLGIDETKIRAATGLAGTFNVCNYTRKTNEAIPHEQVDLDYLVAGTSLPIFLPPVRKGDELYLDSVWIQDANLMEAVRRGAEELWLVWCVGNTADYRPGAFNQYVHMIELSANGALFGEFERIREINERIARGESPYQQRRPIRLHVIKPEHALPLDPELYLGRIDADTLVAMGYADAKSYLARRSEEGLPFEPATTRMRDGALGLRFRETMAGGFALGETDPRLGERKGERAGHQLALRGAVVIHNLDHFVADPDHRGELVGHVSFPPLGQNLPAKSGVFNLFSRTGQPDTKWMVYEMGFEAQGKSYYLAGRKEVRDEPGFDLWKDTTTLFTRLHEGENAAGPVVGAGILHLGPAELVQLVSSMTASHAASAARQAEAILQFGRFFLGELWETYAPEVTL